ncbi:MAG: hypothetical protein MJZ62_06120 [Bacteroidales bacterium]|nr:hypothetical protein [Bacteroidales bacterium]
MNKEELNKEIDRLKVLLANYEELDCDMENPEYVARGNGFCDAKYSEDFIEGQISQIKEKIQKLENQLK